MEHEQCCNPLPGNKGWPSATFQAMLQQESGLNLKSARSMVTGSERPHVEEWSDEEADASPSVAAKKQEAVEGQQEQTRAGNGTEASDSHDIES